MSILDFKHCLFDTSRLFIQPLQLNLSKGHNFEQPTYRPHTHVAGHSYTFHFTQHH